LRLPHVKNALEEVLSSSAPNESRLAWLWRVIEPQYRYRVEGRIERRFRDSKLPEKKTFSGFDFDFQQTLDRDLVLELANLRFIDHGKNVLLAGMSGTGKSHIAKALALCACHQNYRVCYTTSADMLGTLNASLADNSTTDKLKPFVNSALLVIDEVGLEKVEQEEACRAGLMQKVLLPRYSHHRSTIITSNIPWEGWSDYLGDHLGTVAILDRLIHHSHVIVINGPSYREHEHKQEAATDKKPSVTASATP
jgi:DNA replication protein DnaC